jgi:hypothetical protein
VRRTVGRCVLWDRGFEYRLCMVWHLPERVLARGPGPAGRCKRWRMDEENERSVSAWHGVGVDYDGVRCMHVCMYHYWYR